jgi:hypothetical protein
MIHTWCLLGTTCTKVTARWFTTGWRYTAHISLLRTTAGLEVYHQRRQPKHARKTGVDILIPWRCWDCCPQTWGMWRFTIAPLCESYFISKEDVCYKLLETIPSRRNWPSSALAGWYRRMSVRTSWVCYGWRDCACSGLQTVEQQYLHQLQFIPHRFWDLLPRFSKYKGPKPRQ